MPVKTKSKESDAGLECSLAALRLIHPPIFFIPIRIIKSCYRVVRVSDKS